MAVNTLKTLVQRGTCVVRDVVAGATGLGCVVVPQTTALPYPLRHLLMCSLTGSNRGLERHDADNRAAASAAERAGRPERSAGVPSRRPASPAGRTVRYQTVLTGTEPRPLAVWRSGRIPPVRPTAMGTMRSRRSEAFTAFTRRKLAAATRG